MTNAERIEKLEEKIILLEAAVEKLAGSDIRNSLDYDSAFKELMKGNGKPMNIYFENGGKIPENRRTKP